MAMLQRQESKPVLRAWAQLTSSIEIGPEYELGISSEHDSSLRIEALARLFIIDRAIVRPESLSTMVSETYQSIGDALMLLATEDPDTCCAALETLETIIQRASSNAPSKPISLLMAHAHRVVLNAVDAEVVSKAQSVLADALENECARIEFFSLVTDSQLLDTLTKLEDQCLSAPPSNMQSALHLLGFFIDHAYHTVPSAHDTILASTTRYIRLLRMTIVDTNPFDTRFAAAQSMCALHHLWTAVTPEQQPSPLVLGLALVLTDTLDDDDDEIRDAAAHATSTFLSLQTQQPIPRTVPLLASQHLLTHLISTFPTSTPLATHALRRLLTTASPTPLFSIPLTTHLDLATRPQTALFAHEKQNLFHDPLLSPLSWSRILPAALPRPVLDSATPWTADALAALTQRYGSSSDGPLGWASGPDALACVVRAVCIADIVLRAGGATGHVKLGLARLAGAMGEGGGHAGVIRHVEGVLEREVLRQLGVVRGVAREAPGYAAGWLVG